MRCVLLSVFTFLVVLCLFDLFAKENNCINTGKEKEKNKKN